MQKATVVFVFAFILAALGQNFPYCQTCTTQCASPSVCTSNDATTPCFCAEPAKLCGTCSSPDCPTTGYCEFVQSAIDKSYNCSVKCSATPTCVDLNNCPNAVTPPGAQLTAQCPDKTNRFACASDANGRCYYKDQCPPSCNLTTCDLAKPPSEPLNSSCPAGTQLDHGKTARYSCVAEGTGCFWKEECVKPLTCDATCNNATEPDQKVPCPTGTQLVGPTRYVCVNEGNGCYYKDQCVKIEAPVCNKTTCEGAPAPSFAVNSLCPNSDKPRYICVSTLKGCEHQDQCGTGTSCEITASTTTPYTKLCGGKPLPDCPGGFAQISCVSDAGVCAWKYACLPYCGDTCGPRLTCSAANYAPSCVPLAGEKNCSWYPGCPIGNPCKSCTSPCKSPQVQAGGVCLADPKTNQCQFYDYKCVTPTTTCDCSIAKIIPCSVGLVADITTAPKCGATPDICEQNCIRDSYCLSSDPCNTDYTKCYFVECPTDLYKPLSRAYAISEAKTLYETLVIKGANPTIFSSRPSKCSTTPPVKLDTPIEKLEASATDATTVQSATDSFKEVYENTKNAVDDKTGQILLADFVPVVLAIKNNGNVNKPSVDVTVQLIPVTGVTATQDHLDAYCKLLLKTVFPIVTKYTEAEFTSCSLVRIATQKRQATSGFYVASADPSDAAVQRVYSSSTVLYFSLGMLVALIALYLF